MSPKRAIAVAALLLAAAAVASAEDVAARRDALLAPLPVRDQFLLGNGFFFFEPESARVLRPGAWSADLHTADANTFAKSAWISRSLEGQTVRQRALDTIAETRFTSRDTLFLIDGETHRATVAVRAGVAENLEVGVAIPILTVGGGWSDPFIEAVHRTLKIGNDERDALTRNSETVFLRAGATNYLRDRSTGAQLGDVAFTAKYELPWLEDRRVALSAQAAVELPTGNASTLDGSGSFDGGMQLIASHDIGATRVHASLGMLRLGANAPLGTRSQLLITDTVAVVRLLGRRNAANAQLTVSESPFRHLGIREFQRRSVQLTLGMQHAVGETLAVYTGFVENLLNFENSADAALVWGVRWRGER